MGNRYREYLASNPRYYRKAAAKTNDGGLSGLYIGKSDLQAALKELDTLAKKLADDNWRRQVLGDAAELVADAAQKRQAVNDSKQAHYIYKNITRGSRRAKGEAIDDRIKVLPGNLKKSIQYLRHLKKQPTAVIGPRIKTVKKLSALKNLGRSPGNTSGHYAGMSQKAYSGAEDFRRDIMEPALQQTAGRILAHLGSEINQRKKQTTVQLRFWK